MVLYVWDQYYYIFRRDGSFHDDARIFLCLSIIVPEMQLLHRWDKYQWEHYLNKIKPNYIFRMTHLLFFKIEWNAMEFNRIALDWMKLNWMNIFRGTPSPRMNYWNNWEAYSQLNRKYCSKQPAQQNSFVITVYYSCFSVFGNYIWRHIY